MGKTIGISDLVYYIRINLYILEPVLYKSMHHYDIFHDQDFLSFNKLSATEWENQNPGNEIERIQQP